MIVNDLSAHSARLRCENIHEVMMDEAKLNFLLYHTALFFLKLVFTRIKRSTVKKSKNWKHSLAVDIWRVSN